MRKGKILISNYTLINDFEFNKSVILIVENNKKDTIGFVINKKTNYLLSDIDPTFKELKIPIFKGGPVKFDSIHFIHKKSELLEKSKMITEEIFWGNQLEKAIKLIQQQKININEIKFFLGYSGWEKNQLDYEIEEKSWLSTNNYKVSDIFNYDKLIWKKKIEKFGEYYKIWSNSPENPNYN